MNKASVDCGFWSLKKLYPIMEGTFYCSRIRALVSAETQAREVKLQ
jgi:hypothetical protein